MTAPAATHHLAQVNIALPVAPLDCPALADFVAALDEVNALADAAPGFVWRLQTEDGNATAVFAPMGEASQALWRVPAGRRPTVADAERRLAQLRRHGPTEYAFTFRAPFTAPAGPPLRDTADWFCPA